MVEAKYYPVIDASYWNTADEPNDATPVFDISKIKDAGVKAVLLRAGKGVPRLGEDYGVDRHFYTNTRICDAASMPWMPYWRIYDIWNEDPVTQAERFVSAISRFILPNRAPIWVDTEEWVTSSSAPEHKLGEQLIKYWVMTFIDTLIKEGYRNVGIYTRANWWNANIGLVKGMSAHPLWVAKWVPSETRQEFLPFGLDGNTWDEFAFKRVPGGPDLPSMWQRWDIWQFIGEGSGVGKQLGFASEHLDCNIIHASSFENWFN